MPHADGLSWLILKIIRRDSYCFTKFRNGYQTCSIQHSKEKSDKFITEKKNEINDQKENKGNNIFSICNGTLLYGNRVVI